MSSPEAVAAEAVAAEAVAAEAVAAEAVSAEGEVAEPARALPTQPGRAPAVESWRGFPLWTRVSLPPGAAVPIPVGQVLVDATPHPSGEWVLVLTRDADRDNVQWHRWSLSGPLESIPGPDLGELRVSELAWDPFDAGIYVVGRRGGVTEISRCGAIDEDGCRELLTVDGELSGLRVPLVRWDGEVRVFATVSNDGQRRVVSVRRDGSGAYDLTHPAGSLTELTDPVLRSRARGGQGNAQPPRVLRISDAALVDVDPASGSAWIVAFKGLRRLDWSLEEGNWSTELEPSTGASSQGAANQLRISRNGRFRVELVAATMRLVDRDGVELDRIAVPEDARLVDLGPTGRCAVLEVSGPGLQTACFTGQAAATRHLDRVWPEAVSPLLEHGLAYTAASTQGRSSHPTTPEAAPLLVSVDDMSVLLHAGMSAVLLEHERSETLPAFRSFLAAVEAAAVDDATSLGARAGLHLLAHGPTPAHSDPQVEAELGRMRAELPKLGRGLCDRLLRGPGASDPELNKLAWATWAVDRMPLSDDARQRLAADPSVVAAWHSWADAQAAFSMGQPTPVVFVAKPRSPWMNPACLPDPADRTICLRSWGPDQEIIARLTDNGPMPLVCGVAERPLPSGLDVLAAFGSSAAESILLTSPEGRYPALPERLAAVKARSTDAPGIAGSRLSVVRALAESDGAPAMVAEALWQRRIMESGLSVWVDVRKPILRVAASRRLKDDLEEGLSTEAVDGRFERLQLEPASPVIDPLPEVWSALGRSFELIAARVDHGESEPLHQRLDSLAQLSHGFAAMAAQQMAGEALSADEYDRIMAAFGGHDATRLGAGLGTLPQTDARIVDIHRATLADGSSQVFHIARGRPRPITVLLEDRGVVVPARGSVGSYYELVGPDLLTDASWARELDVAARPPWLNPGP